MVMQKGKEIHFHRSLLVTGEIEFRQVGSAFQLIQSFKNLTVPFAGNWTFDPCLRPHLEIRGM